ncbi:MAG: SPOR domain-containing protein [Methylovulum sp.]|jgi:DedD protein|nr:SPOR domain-containing protein [Methylovulum sp.]MCF7998595.1 SPOR domain-containing protein [Methylovulum sp.]
MNQELRQRLIGAVVVTALAAIFIPMLFDDPVEEKIQVVSELGIPQEPMVSVDDNDKKLPDDVSNVAALAESQTNSLEEPNATEQTGNDVLSTDELEAEAPGEEEQEPVVERPVTTKGSKANGKSGATLDTGIVDEQADEPVVTASSKPVQKAIQKPTVLKTDVITPAKTVKAKPIANEKAIDVSSSEKNEPTTKINPEPSRWYIQAGSFSKKENAMSLSDSLRKQGMPVLLETIQVAGKGTFYRLKVGPELDKKRASQMKAKLDQQNIQSILVGE